jgi:hypothetical protein
MRALLALGVLGFAMLGVGCAMIGSGVDHVVYAAKESIEVHREYARYRRWADEAWGEAAAAAPAGPAARDYGDGFRDGFVDYLDAGGTGEPPPLPPRRYQSLGYQSPEGYEAIDAWFAGYRHGAAVARQGPYRDWITGPSALRAPSATISQVAGEPVPPPLPPPVPVPVVPPANAEPLPFPRKEAAVPVPNGMPPPPRGMDQAGDPLLYRGTGWRRLRPVSYDQGTR